LLECLEERTLLDNGQWLAVINGIPPADNAADQIRHGQDLFHSVGLLDQDVAVVDVLDLSGTFVVQTPVDVTEETLANELKRVPGFQFLDDYFPEGEEEAERERTGWGDKFPDDGYGPGSSNVGLVGNEPAIAVNPLNPNNVVVAQYNNGAQTMKISLDGGTTFPITRNAVLPAGASGFAGDDSLAFDATGRLFWTYLTFPGPIDVVSLQVNPTTGAVIGTPSFVATGNLDKDWLAADKNPASPFANNLYSVWNDFNQTNAPVRFSRSTNQGATWTTIAGNLSGAGEGFTWPAEVAVAPNGDVWVAWHTNTSATVATLGEVRMRRSTDGGLTFGPEIIPFPAGTAATTTNSATGLANKITGLHVWLQGSMQPRILIDPVRPGNIYVVSVDDPDAFDPTNDPSDIVIARSTDNGATWTRKTISQGLYGDSEFMPAAAIDAAGNIAVTWYDNRRHLVFPDSLGGTHYQLDLFANFSLDGGLTFTAPMQVSDPANPFDPELGAPDRFGNHTLRIGEYNGLALVNRVGYAAWTINSATGQQIVFDKFAIGLTVTSTVPANGAVVFTRPTAFTVNVSFPVNPATVMPSDFKVNGIPADSVSYTPGTTSILFTFATSPVSAQGLQTMHLDAGAFTAASDGSPLVLFDGTFRYDVVQLQVTSTVPPVGGTFILPGPFTYDVNFNEPIDPASVQRTDLILRGLPGAVVTAVTVLPGNTTARFTISGITVEGIFTVDIAARAITDAFGNPGAAFTGTYSTDIVTAPYPTPLTPENPPGSLVYDPSYTGLINFAGDTDSLTLVIDPGQTITLLVTPSVAGLQPAVQMRDPSGTLLGSATAAAAGQKALLQTVATTTGGTYTFTVSASGGTTGFYTLQVILNTALENESNLVGASNDTRATAQDLNASFVNLQTSLTSAQRGAVRGANDLANYTAAAVTSVFEDISGTGTVITGLTNQDDASVSIAMGLTFPFYGTNYTSVFVSSNGLLTFGTGTTAAANTNLTTSPTQAAIAAFWGRPVRHRGSQLPRVLPGARQRRQPAPGCPVEQRVVLRRRAADGRRDVRSAAVRRWPHPVQLPEPGHGKQQGHQ
jgi:hypothetical protein